MLAFFLGLGTLCVGSLLRRRFRTMLALIAALAIAAAALTAAFDRMPASEARDRIASLVQPHQTLSAHYRLQTWRDTLRIWNAHSSAGVGANAFRMVYPLFRTTSDSAFMTHAENAYVQSLAEKGLIGALLMALLILAASRQARAIGRSGTAPTAVASFGVPAACLIAAFNAAFDFPLHTPLYAGVLSVLAALSLSAPADSRAEREEPARIVPFSLVAGLLAALVFGLTLKPMHLRDTPRAARSATPDQLARAIAWAPTSWQDWYSFGRQACLMNSPESWALGERCIAQAAAYDPNNYRLWLELGKLRLHLGDRAGARQAFERVRALRAWVPLPPVPGDAP